MALVVPTASSALLALQGSDLILPLPEPLAWQALRMGMKIRAFELPLALDGVLITQAWHPRHQMAPAHQWLRRAIRELTAADRGEAGPAPAR